MIELLNNKWIWILAGSITALVAYKLFFSKNKDIDNLEKEYSEVINSDKYKVKGQFD